MPNVLFTQRCVRSCPYCFADRHMTKSQREALISWEDLIYVADFLEAAGERRFPILGGEPTLHPEFNAMVLYLLKRGFHVHVFTSGIMAQDKLREAIHLFRDVPPDFLGFVVNLNDPERTRTPFAETESVNTFLAAFGHRTTPGFNIYQLDFDLGFIFEKINEYGLRRSIRIGVAHPMLGTKNSFVAPEDFDAVIARLFSFVPLFETLRVKPGLDCGFPQCRFSDEQLGWLYRHTGGNYDFGCGPVVDIGPDLQMWPCFPLSSFHKKSLFEFNDLGEVLRYYEQLHQNVRTEVAGIFDECDHCHAREEGLCKAGCLAHNLNRFQDEVPVRMEDMYL